MSCADDRFTDQQLALWADWDMEPPGVDCDPDWPLDPLWWRMPWPVYRENAHADRVTIAQRYRTAI